MATATTISLERPKFGQFARQIADIRASELESCLEEQRETGGRIGDIMLSRGLLEPEQVQQILRMQAQWVAETCKADLGGELPKNTFLSVCLPAYNEAENIRDTVESALAILPEFVARFEIVVVDDGSKDATAAIVRKLSENDARVRLVQHDQNRGYGAAVSTGLREAHGDLIMFCDSDGQFSLLDLPQVLSRIEDHDVVLGYRYNRADNTMRLVNAKCWNLLIRACLGVAVRDLDCAFKLFRREVVDRLQLTASGAAINAEILAQCFRGKLRMCEMPVNHYPRYKGAPTGAALKVIAKAFRELPRMLKYRFAAQVAVTESTVNESASTARTTGRCGLPSNPELVAV